MIAKFDHIFEQLLEIDIEIKGKININVRLTFVHTSFSFCTKIIHTLIHIFYTKIIHISILGYKNFKLVEDSLNRGLCRWLGVGVMYTQILVIDGQQIIDIDMSDTKFNFFLKISNLIL